MCIFLELFTCLMPSPSPKVTFDWLSSLSFLEEMLLWFEVTEEAFEGVAGKLGSRNLVAYLKCPSHCFRYESAAVLPALPNSPLRRPS